MSERCIPVKELQKYIPLSRTQLNRYRNDPVYAGLGFPKPVMLGQCRICWWLHEILEWMKNRPRA